MWEKENLLNEEYLAHELILWLLEGESLQKRVITRHPFDGLTVVKKMTSNFCNLDDIRDWLSSFATNVDLNPLQQLELSEMLFVEEDVFKEKTFELPTLNLAST